jgi:hypothetical protein
MIQIFTAMVISQNQNQNDIKKGIRYKEIHLYMLFQRECVESALARQKTSKV